MKLIERQTQPVPLLVNGKDMKIGQVGYIRDNSSYEGLLVLRAWGSLISLTNPHKVWLGHNCTELNLNVTLKVEVLPPGTKLIFEVDV